VTRPPGPDGAIGRARPRRRSTSRGETRFAAQRLERAPGKRCLRSAHLTQPAAHHHLSAPTPHTPWPSHKWHTPRMSTVRGPVCVCTCGRRADGACLAALQDAPSSWSGSCRQVKRRSAALTQCPPQRAGQEDAGAGHPGAEESHLGAWRCAAPHPSTLTAFLSLRRPPSPSHRSCGHRSARAASTRSSCRPTATFR
jgi:hypothetical protein